MTSCCLVTQNPVLQDVVSLSKFPPKPATLPVSPATPNQELLVTRAAKFVSVGHRDQGENDDQTDKDGTDN